MRSRRLVLLGLVPALLVIATLVWLGALFPGEGKADKAEAATTGVKAGSELHSLRQPPVGEGSSVNARVSGSDGDDHDKWNETSKDSDKDIVQTIVNNDSSNGGQDVHFTIENKGESSVRVGTAPQRGNFSGGSQQLIPPGARERVHFLIQPGEFLLAKCEGVAGKKCSWTISHLAP